jgi:hypothetical protein
MDQPSSSCKQSLMILRRQLVAARKEPCFLRSALATFPNPARQQTKASFFTVSFPSVTTSLFIRSTYIHSTTIL